MCQQRWPRIARRSHYDSRQPASGLNSSVVFRPDSRPENFLPFKFLNDVKAVSDTSYGRSLARRGWRARAARATFGREMFCPREKFFGPPCLKAEGYN